jgi:3',5'-cyclic AMP phosphodiesterase CpdA
LITVLTIALLSCDAPRFWIQKYRDMDDAGDLKEWERNETDKRTLKKKNEDIDNYYQQTYGWRDTPYFEASPIEVKESRLVVRKEVDGVNLSTGALSDSGAKFTFVHLSDVQLRDEQVRLFDKETSDLADNLISSFEHHPFVEAFDGAIYYAIVQTINTTAALGPRGPALTPTLMIHTGDAIDAGVITELYEFVYISNELSIPWYNVIGNHDIGTFGNIDPGDMYVNDPFVDFMTIHGELGFINMHHNADDYPVPAPVTPTNWGNDAGLMVNNTLYTRFNGFDRRYYSGELLREKVKICDSCPGYYSLEVRAREEYTKDPAIQMIVLNTGFSFGARGKIDEDQLDWLKSEIDTCSDKLVIVCGHHNIETIDDGERIADLFARSPAVIAYLCGHKHHHNINYHSGPDGGFGFWEVITDAIFAYPQQGSLVTISFDGEVGLLDVYAFDHTIKKTYTDEEGNTQNSTLYEHARLARKGAINDITDEEKSRIDGNMEDRYARLRFPYPVLK